jgi:hypothetical protein
MITTLMPAAVAMGLTGLVTTTVNPRDTGFRSVPPAALVPRRGQPDGCIKISGAPAPHQPDVNPVSTRCKATVAQ